MKSKRGPCNRIFAERSFRMRHRRTCNVRSPTIFPAGLPEGRNRPVNDKPFEGSLMYFDCKLRMATMLAFAPRLPAQIGLSVSPVRSTLELTPGLSIEGSSREKL